VRTVQGTVYLTASDQDMAESKVIALLNRTYLQARDLVDLFLFESALAPDSVQRVAAKLKQLSLSPSEVAHKISRLRAERDHLIRTIDAVVTGQVDAEAAAQIAQGGGAASIFGRVMQVLEQRLGLGKAGQP
jgi:hypothetical protein